jgi:TPR repeat protein
MFEMGRGGPLNLKLARQLYQQAIDGGHVHSAVNMAWMIHENPQAFANQVEGLAYCFWARDNADPSRTEEYRTSCEDMGAAMTPAMRTQAEEMARNM